MNIEKYLNEEIGKVKYADMDEYFKLLKSIGFTMVSGDEKKSTWKSVGGRVTLEVVNNKRREKQNA